MNEEQIQEVWTLFKEYLDKKHVETAAERYVDLLADYGIDDHVLIESMGSCTTLDNAIKYYLDDEEEVHDDEDGYDWEE
jgi:hypothetical protein